MPTRPFHASGIGRGLSLGSLWAKCPIFEYLEGDLDKGYGYIEDFNRFGSLASDTANANYLSYQDTGGTIVQVATKDGVIRLETDGTDEDSVDLQIGGSGGPFHVTDTAGSIAPLWFETRFRVSSAALTGLSLFMGLSEAGSIGDSSLADATGVLNDKDHIGFRIVVADTDGLDAVYLTEGGSEGVVKESAQDIALATWYKAGFTYDGTHCWWWIDGAKVHTAGVLPAATGFPDEQQVMPVFKLKSTTANAHKLDLDWVAVFQGAVAA